MGQCDPVHNQGLRLCLGAFRTTPVESLYVDVHEPCLGARRAKLSLQYASKIKSLPKHPTHDAEFDNKYIKLFDLRIKQFLTASNIDFSDILETPSYFVLPPWCIKPPKIVLDLVHLKKDRINSYSWKYDSGSVITFLFIQMVHGMGIVWLLLQSFHQTLSTRLPDSASIFTADAWAIIIALEQIKDSIASKYIIFTLTFVSPCFAVYEAGSSLDRDGDTKVCLFKCCQ